MPASYEYVDGSEQLAAPELKSECQRPDPNKHDVIEVGAALFHVESRDVVRSFSTLIAAEANAAVAINNISSHLLSLDIVKKAQLEPLLQMFDESTWILAHNAKFDRAMLQKLFQKHDITEIERDWVCTSTQISFPKRPIMELSIPRHTEQ